MVYSHISNITNKANSVYGFLRRNFSNCTTKIKGELNKSMVRPILEYACNVWCPHHNKDIQLIEAAQRIRRFCMNCYSRYESVTSMLEKLKWPTLTDHRDDLKLVMLYKIIHGYVHVQLTLPLTYSSLNSVTRGHHNKILQPPIN